jgi:hypothetical protein
MKIYLIRTFWEKKYKLLLCKIYTQLRILKLSSDLSHHFLHLFCQRRSVSSFIQYPVKKLKITVL